MMRADTFIRLKLIIGTLILLILTLSFNSLMSLSSLDKIYSESLSGKIGNSSEESNAARIKEQVRNIHNTAFIQNIHNIAIITACAVLLLIVVNFLIFNGLRYRKDSETALFPKKKVFTAILVVVVLSQSIFSWLNVRYISTIIPSDHFSRILSDSATVLLISLFFFGEMLIFFSQMIEKNIRDTETEVHYNIIRPVIFFLMFGTDIAFSFIPIYMEKIYKPIWGLSKDVVSGLPISVSVFCTGLAFFIAGIWHDKRGWHEPFFAGILLTGIGLLYAWIAPDAVSFIISRAVSGTGYGLFFMASQGFVISYSDKNSKAHGLAVLFASLYAGTICGSATGAMLSEHIGYRTVFLIGAMFVFSSSAYPFIFMRHAIRKEKAQIAVQSRESAGIKEFLHFLSDRNVFAVIFLSSIPASMAATGFGDYFNPLYLSRIGTSQSDIGRIFIIYGIFLIYAGPVLSKLVDRSENRKTCIVTGGIIGSAAFLAFYLFQGLSASLITIFLLGLSHSFIFVSQTAYLLKLNASEELGDGKALAMFRLMNRVGQTLGPIVFGWLIAIMNFDKSAICFGISYLLITFIFIFLAEKENKSEGLNQDEIYYYK